MKRALLAFCTGLTAAAAVTFASPNEARANGRIPASSYIAFSPSDPNFIVARVTFGLLFSKDAGKSWFWACEQSIGYNGPEDPAIGVFQSNAVVATLAGGLVLSPDQGCTFGFAPAPKQFFIDVAIRKSDAKAGYALLSAYANQEDDAGRLLFTTQVWSTGDNGGSWSKVGNDLDPTILGETLDVAESNPQRLYASAIRGNGDAVSAVLLVSDDAGKSWIERPIPLTKDERAGFIAAVDPKNADRVYVRTSATADLGARLLVSSDAGKTWDAKFVGAGALLGFALSDDGSKVWVGGPKDGLHQASATDLAFTKKSSTQIQCLAVGPDGKLWACSNEASGFTLGQSPDEGATFASKMHLNEVRGPLACPAGSSADQCNAFWPDQKRALGIDTTGDGGASSSGGAGDGGNGATPPGDDGKCNCSTPGAPAGAGVFALVAGVLAALGIARKRRR